MLMERGLGSLQRRRPGCRLVGKEAVPSAFSHYWALAGAQAGGVSTTCPFIWCWLGIHVQTPQVAVIDDYLRGTWLSQAWEYGEQLAWAGHLTPVQVCTSSEPCGAARRHLTFSFGPGPEIQTEKPDGQGRHGRWALSPLSVSPRRCGADTWKRSNPNVAFSSHGQLGSGTQVRRSSPASGTFWKWRWHFVRLTEQSPTTSPA